MQCDDTQCADDASIGGACRGGWGCSGRVGGEIHGRITESVSASFLRAEFLIRVLGAGVGDCRNYGRGEQDIRLSSPLRMV